MSTSYVIGNRIASNSLIANLTQSFTYKGVVAVVGDRAAGAYIDQTTHFDNAVCTNINYLGSCNCCGDSGPPYYDCNVCDHNVLDFTINNIPSRSFNNTANDGYYDSATKKGFKSFATTDSSGGSYSALDSYESCATCDPPGIGPSSLVGVGAYAAVKEHDGSLWTWGYQYANQLGDISTSAGTTRLSPTQIGSFSWKMVSSGANCFLAIRYDGLLFGWGSTSYGQLANAGGNSPVQIGSDTWKYVAGGADYTTAGIKSDNTLWLWGRNIYGQIGDGTTVDRSSPVQVAGGGLWQYAYCNGSNTFAIKTDGTLWGWGAGNILGDGTTTSRSSPVQIGSAYNDWTHVTAHTIGTAYAIRKNGTAWGWGYFPHGLPNPNNVNYNGIYSLPVQIGSSTNHVSCSIGHSYHGAAVSGNSVMALFITTGGNLVGYTIYSLSGSNQVSLYSAGGARAVTQDHNVGDYNLPQSRMNTFLIKNVT